MSVPSEVTTVNRRLNNKKEGKAKDTYAKGRSQPKKGDDRLWIRGGAALQLGQAVKVFGI